MKVNFIIVGAMKCGTRTLSKILSGHPEVSFSNPEEPGFFSHSKNWKAEINDYHKLFQEKEGVIYGESSTAYTNYPYQNLEIWKDIYAYNKDMKLIYVVRNPVDRVISHYMQSFQRGYTKLPLEKAILESSWYIDLTRYYTQIKPFVEQFGIEKVLIIDFDDVVNNLEKVVEELTNFLEISLEGFKNYKKTHQNPSIGKVVPHHKFDKFFRLFRPLTQKLPESLKKILWIFFKRKGFDKKPELSPELRRMIVNMTELDIKALSNLTGKDFTKWLSEK